MLDALGVVYVCTGMQVGVAWTWKLRKNNDNDAPELIFYLFMSVSQLCPTL